MFKGIKTSYDLKLENVELLINEFIGAKLLARKELQRQVKAIDEEIKDAKDELITEMRQNGIKEARLDDEFNVLYMEERTAPALMPKKAIVKAIREEFDISSDYPDFEIENVITKGRITKAHIRIVASETA